MAALADLAHELTTYWSRAALCRDMGEYGLAEYLDRKAAEVQAEIERLDAGVVKECGVS